MAPSGQLEGNIQETDLDTLGGKGSPENVVAGLASTDDTRQQQQDDAVDIHYDLLPTTEFLAILQPTCVRIFGVALGTFSLLQLSTCCAMLWPYSTSITGTASGKSRVWFG